MAGPLLSAEESEPFSFHDDLKVLRWVDRLNVAWIEKRSILHFHGKIAGMTYFKTNFLRINAE